MCFQSYNHSAASLKGESDSLCCLRRSEDIKRNVTANHGQRKGYEIISKELDVPVTTAADIMKKFKADGAAADISGRGHKRKTV